jgi:hypothetical protein
MGERKRGADGEPADDAGVLVTRSARALKQELGPTGWAVLEDVVLDALTAGRRWEARTSVRLIAEHLGLTPGTVARALARLCNQGVVHREDRRDSVTGRFGESVYVIDPLPGVVPCVDIRDTEERDTAMPHTADPNAEKHNTEERDPERPAAVRPARAGRKGQGAEPGQLALLGADSAVDAPAPSLPSRPLTNQSTSNPLTPNHQTPTTNQPNYETNSSTQPPNSTTQRPSNTCQPFGQALSGRASC